MIADQCFAFVNASSGRAVPKGLPARLATIDVGADRRQLIAGDNTAVISTECAVDKISVVINIVHRGKQHGINTGLLHVPSKKRQPPIHFLGAECR